MKFRRLLKDDGIDKWAAFTISSLICSLLTMKMYGFISSSLKVSPPNPYTLISPPAWHIVWTIYSRLFRDGPVRKVKRVKFHLWEVTHSCLNTMDRLQKLCPWINLFPSCTSSFCLILHINKEAGFLFFLKNSFGAASARKSNETVKHIFFDCPFSREMVGDFGGF